MKTFDHRCFFLQLKLVAPSWSCCCAPSSCQTLPAHNCQITNVCSNSKYVEKVSDTLSAHVFNNLDPQT